MKNDQPTIASSEKKQDDGDNSIALGLCFGVLLGVLWDNLALGMAFGLAFGASVSLFKNKNSKKGA
ncbi:hypothetical protein [uncultured Ruthenibacterium sp.]|uniref:hypothetical protein n=1 Tax=uncultured Ruthenibacterium sp. TaxID=1905347 RepID=UPI00349E4DAC